jgi:hypothetical protein
VGRSFSTCLMHGSASALVGVAIGLFRYGHGRARLLSAVLGWAAAIFLHSGFNRVVEYWDGAAYLVGAVGLGVGGVILIYAFIRWGLRVEKQWIDETLDMKLGVTRKEKSLVLDLDKVEELLKPVRQRFGKEKTAQVQEFLLKQAQLGIKQKARQLTADSADGAVLEEQIAALQIEMDAIRRNVGVYCMTYVRSIFPPESVVLWSSLEQLVAEARQRPVQFDMWGKLRDSARAQTNGEPGG